MIIGMRGGGKTYGAKKWCIRDFLRNGKQFGWVRRFQSELDEALKGFFNPLLFDEDLVKEFGTISYEVKGGKLYINDKLAGHSFSLTSANKIKSSEYPLVDKIIFDEFLIERGSSAYYLKGEVEMLFGIMESIFRQRENGRVILIANSVSYSNPYFMFFKIKPFTKEYLHIKDRSLLIHLYYNEEFAKSKRQSKFGSLISGTGYESYAIDNNFVDLSDTFIEKKTAGVKFSCVVRYEGRDYGFWVDTNRGLMFASNDIDPSGSNRYVISELEHDINYMLVLNYKATHLYEIMNYYTHGLLRFEDNIIKSAVLMMLSII